MSEYLCRMCLIAGNVKMYLIKNTRLQELYENVASTKLNPDDGKPVTVCYICCSQLQRYYKFSNMSRRAEKTITDLVNNGMEVTQHLLIMLNLGMTHNLNITTTGLISINSSLNNTKVSVKEEIIDDEEKIAVETKPADLPSSVCRVCLAVQSRTYCIETLGLKDIFERVTTTKLNTEDGRPVTICYICLSQLKKCQRVSEMCQLTEKLLANDSNEAEIKKLPALRLNIEMVHNVGVGTTQPPVALENSLKSDLVTVKIEFQDETKHTTELADEKEVTVTIFKSHSNFVCHVCSKNFKTKSGLVSHLPKHALEKPFNCEHCKKTFHTKSNLSKHTRNNGKYNCCHCSNTFKSKETLQSHMRVHGENKYTCIICNKILSGKMSLQRHMLTHSGETPYKCDECCRSFADPYQLKKHLIRHTGVMPFSCNVCGKGYYDNHNFKIHVQSHTGVRPYECDRCGRKFMDPSCRSRHMKIHTGERPHACSYCNMTFLRNSILLLHLRTHTGIKPYGCDQCSMSYYSSSSLNKHMKLHNEIKTYKCTMCDNLFSNERSLKIHKKTHKDYKPQFICDTCNRTFSQYTFIVRHIRTHTGEKPYACSKCEMRYPTPTARLRHERTHEGKLYACKLCDKKYSRKGGLQGHVNKKHTKQT